MSSRALRRLAAEVADLRRQVKGLSTGQPLTGTVVAVNTAQGTVDVDLADQDIALGLPLHHSYTAPEVGHTVVLLGDTAPVVLGPPQPSSTNAQPAQVQNLTVTGSVGEVNIKFDANTDISVTDNRGYYEIHVDTSPNFDSGNLIDLHVAATHKTVGGLANATPYYVRVRAVNMYGDAGPWAATVQATTTLKVIADAISGTEIMDGGVWDSKLAAYPIGWNYGPSTLVQNGITCGTGWGRYRFLGVPNAGALVVACHEIPVADANGTVGHPIEVYAYPGTDDAIWGPASGFAYGHWQYLHAADGRRYSGDPAMFDIGGGDVQAAFHLWYGDGNVRTGAGLGEDPSIQVGINDYFRAFLVYESVHL